MAFGYSALGALTTTFCSHRDLIIGLSRKKPLIPKVSEKWCAEPLASTYQGDLRYFLLRLSELPRQHGRATR